MKEAHATQLLIQADWLPSELPIWNSNKLLSEQSIIGQLASANFGYEATPTLIQLYFYLVSLSLIPLTLLGCHLLLAKKENQAL